MLMQYWPVGHWMFSWTRVCLRVPSMAAVSILGWFPQSAQYMVLKGNTELEHTITKHTTAEKKNMTEIIYFIWLLLWRHRQRAQHSLLPSLWIHYDGIRLVYHARYEGLAMLAWHLSHFDYISTRVGPVQVTSHPVHRYTTRHLQLFDLDTSREAIIACPCNCMCLTSIWPALPAGWWSCRHSEHWKRRRTRTWTVLEVHRRRCGPCASWSRRCGRS